MGEVGDKTEYPEFPLGFKPDEAFKILKIKIRVDREKDAANAKISESLNGIREELRANQQNSLQVGSSRLFHHFAVIDNYPQTVKEEVEETVDPAGKKISRKVVRSEAFEDEIDKDPEEADVRSGILEGLGFDLNKTIYMNEIPTDIRNQRVEIVKAPDKEFPNTFLIRAYKDRGNGKMAIDERIAFGDEDRVKTFAQNGFVQPQKTTV